MSDKTKEFILKFLIVTGLAAFALIFPGGLVWAFLITDEKIGLALIYVLLLISFISGALFMILGPIFGGIKEKPTVAEKKPITFCVYAELLSFLNDRLLQEGYQLQKSVLVTSECEVSLYLKSDKLSYLKGFTIIRAPELSNELIENSNDGITNILTEYYGKKIITDTVDMISVFCVDRMTPALKNLLNTNLSQGFKNGRFLAGISFGRKNMYLATQKGGFAILKYKRLRKEFLDIIDSQSE